MTPKEKANDLFQVYLLETGNESFAKNVAMISVYQIINSNPHSNPLNTEVYSTMDWWQEVKNELEKL